MPETKMELVPQTNTQEKTEPTSLEITVNKKATETTIKDELSKADINSQVNISTQDFLDAFYDKNETVCLQVIPDRKDDVFTGKKYDCECSQFSSNVLPDLKKHNQANRGISFIVNGGGHKKEEISVVKAQFVESDTLPFDQMKEKIDAFPLPPSIIIKTRKSLHCYWLMCENPQIARFTHIQKQLVKQFQGDPQCVNANRAMRLPGFYHCKQEPIMVTCIWFHPELKYTQDQLSEYLPEVEDDEQYTSEITSQQQSLHEQGLDIVAQCDFIGYCRENAKSLPEPLWYAMITNLAVFKDGNSLIHELSKPYDDYDKRKTDAKIAHFIKSGTRPIRCETIAANGFSCPKRQSGECQCKAPAALCYQPLHPDTISRMIDGLPVEHNALKDMSTATEFIKKYMYNQDISIASSMLNAIKSHFGFTNADIKPLQTLFKEKSKKYKAGSAVGQTNMTSNMPAWYKSTGKGIKFLPGILAEDMARTCNVIYAAEQYYLYHNGVYEPITECEAERMVQEKMMASDSHWNQITDAEKQWRIQITKNIRELNANPYLINIRDGLYNVIENKLYPHTPDILSTIQLHVSYNSNAECPLFRKFLTESMDNDMEQVNLIQEMLGYFLIPISKAQKSFIIVGAAGAGKSVLLRVLSELLLGKENVSNVSWQALNERFKPAELFGKLANVFADLPTKNIDDNGIFKALVGEDYLTVEKKNKDPFSFQNTARLLFSCNNIPNNYGDKSDGFYRRLIIIRFAHAVPPEKRDPDLFEKFKDEANGIFLFALEGLRRLINNNYRFSETEKNRQELDQYKKDSDSVLSFAADCCSFEEKSDTGSTELYERYVNYCTESGFKDCSQKKFIQKIIASFPQTSRGKDKLGNRRVIHGIKLLNDTDI